MKTLAIQKTVLFVFLAMTAASILLPSCDKDEIEKEPIVKDSTDSINNDSLTFLCIPSGLKDGIIAFYPFSKGSLNDFSGNNIDLERFQGSTTLPIPVTDRNGNDSCAYGGFQNLSGYNGMGSYLISDFSPFDSINMDDFSVSLWYLAEDTLRNPGYFETLICKDNADGSWTPSCPDARGEWSIGLYDCRKAVFGRQNSVWDTSISTLGCQDEINSRTGTWHHVVATYNNANEEMKIYRDGVLQDTSIGVAGCNPANAFFEQGPIIIGEGFTGCMDDIIIYNRTLSQTDVNALSTMGTCCSN